MVIGTSLAVYPAAGLVDYTKRGIDKYLIDPGTPELISYSMDWTPSAKKSATEGVWELTQKIIEIDN
jgi:NAD-dependent deacetylase